jgi:hypothetical protein
MQIRSISYSKSQSTITGTEETFCITAAVDDGDDLQATYAALKTKLEVAMRRSSYGASTRLNEDKKTEKL